MRSDQVVDASLRLYVGQEQHVLVVRGWEKFRGGRDKVQQSAKISNITLLYYIKVFYWLIVLL